MPLFESNKIMAMTRSDIHNHTIFRTSTQLSCKLFRNWKDLEPPKHFSAASCHIVVEELPLLWISLHPLK